ncbi:mynd finger family protein [Colletotrichum truncatum]|uniref:Mynd finger family protein n=1 Tax=Colletotrichum truncatum TaxID=5467 RepID=A0ACC3Z6N9_COLTU|nr:mynd finger family protein [Colletotrichum truncatum]KAF6787983.1 mynd finger family protein [Colletotrichum truncatum]
MLTPTVANSTTFFYPVGNTPALNLARALPQGLDVSLLLLGCGDVRHILHTAYNEVGLPSRSLDITCNDLDEAIIARNILLFSLLLDNDASTNTPWSLYYDLRLSKSDLDILSAQLKKLIAASESLASWKASSYGKALPFSDQATFDDVRTIWKSFHDAASSDDISANMAALQANLRYSLEIRGIAFGNDAQVMTGLRSAAPVALQNFQNIIEASESYWKSAFAEPSGSANIPNPLFAATLSKHRVLHYGTDPILGFHLANAFVTLSNSSPLRPEQKDDELKAYAAAKTQFREWAAACGTLLKTKKLVIRSVVSDALAFCQTLQHFVVTKERSGGWYRRQFDVRSLSLDPDVYGSKRAAPTSFDAIDTSNLADYLGTLSLITSALPLLTARPWSSLFTETLLKTEETTKQAFDKLLFGDGPTISLLLGASPVEYWTNSTAVSWVDEILIGLTSGMSSPDNQTQSQCHCRINWKQSKFFSGVNTAQPLKVDPEALAGVVFKTYLDIFAHENPMKLLSISKASMTQLIRNTAYTNFHRGTLVALLRYLKLRLSVSDFETTIRILLEKYSFERSLMFTGNLRQELSLQLHTQDLFSEDWLRRDIRPNRNLGGFDSWESIPEVVAVSLVVPKEGITRMFSGSDQAKIASPTVRGAMVSGKDADHKWHNFFDDVQLAFGTIKTSGDRETNAFSVTIEPDPAGWAGDSPLIASFYVPAAALQVERKTSYVRLEVQASAQNIAVYQKTLGEELKIHEAKLGDESSVYIAKHLPGQTRYPATCEAAGAVAESETQTKGETQAIFTADITKEQDKIATITGHLDFLSDKGKKLLTDKVPVTMEQESPFTINIVFGNKEHVYPLVFPIPVDASKAKTRIARKSAYFEVIAPLATPSTDPQTKSVLSDFVYPTTLARNLSNIPADLNTPHFNLDRLPIIDLTDKAANRWITTLLSFQFSVREKAMREEVNAGRESLSTSNRLNFKESLFTMFMLSTGLQGGQTGLFSLSHPDGSGTHMLIFVSAVRLDASSGSIVLDAAVIPFTESIVKELESFLLILRTLEMCSITVNDEELVFWRKVLPSLAERSRTWDHKSSCEYSKAGSAPVSLRIGEPILCSCGAGRLPDDFVGLPEWDTAAKYATRVAISPTFAVPFVDDVVDFDAWKQSGGGAARQEPQERCTNCGKTSGKDGAALKKCMRCLRVKYCSGECQKKDWRKHRGECEESDEYLK